MNYQKLDAALSTAINEVQNSETPTLTVFIHTEPVLDANAIAVLENLGVSNVTPGKDIFTATLSANSIAQLSEQPWVQHLKLSQKLHLVNARLNFKKLSV
ncbi:hypothetical protein H6G41_08740 [Tolypothrix sp. FACHB-123]|uniref:hypothetical protein n=1 Tax=Tolypothrix sp. FACHB-123 TaxID=2692868 RepID=UPI001687ED80|nr:hypothetical protein [Tolypothrix sp. FACHB-123]MBD2354714.1 hypothetical protein [Tolypothrix sp. FACHB-123]